MSKYILVSNDDGVDAQGLLVLKQALETVPTIMCLPPRSGAFGTTRAA